MRHRSLSVATVAALLFLAGTVHADDRAAARPLFDEGRRLMKAGKVAEACDKFEAASHLTSTSGVRLNLAACWAKLGRTASAWGMYDEARALADRDGNTGAAELAQKGKAELEPKLSRLVVAVSGGNTVGLEVTRDGEPVYSGAWGVGVPVDPGEHEVAARAPGHTPWSTKASVVGEGASVTVTVPALESATVEVAAVPPAPVPAPTSSPAPPASVAPEEPRAKSSLGSTQRTVGLITGGVGVVALGIGTYFGIKTASEKSDYEAHAANGRCLDATCQSDNQSALNSGHLATAFVAVGAAVVAGGAVVWLTAPKAHETGLSARLAPTFNPRNAGLSLEGSW